MRVLGLDLGSVTCGVAVSDMMGMVARGVLTLRFPADDYAKAAELVKEQIEEFQVKTVVLGLPKHMNGDRNSR